MVKYLKPSQYRKFGGKRYENDKRFTSKRDANARAKKLRRAGYCVRVVPVGINYTGRGISKGWHTYSGHRKGVVGYGKY